MKAKTKMVRMQIFITPDQKARLKRHAKIYGKKNGRQTSAAEVIRNSLDHYLM